MRMVWLSLGATVAAIVAACAAGEDNSEVQVAAETNLPQCTPRPSGDEQKVPPDPTNGSRDVDNSGSVVGSSSGASSSRGASSSGGGSPPDDCPNSSSSSSSSGSQ